MGHLTLTYLSGPKVLKIILAYQENSFNVQIISDSHSHNVWYIMKSRSMENELQDWFLCGIKSLISPFFNWKRCFIERCFSFQPTARLVTRATAAAVGRPVTATISPTLCPVNAPTCVGSAEVRPSHVSTQRVFNHIKLIKYQ